MEVKAEMRARRGRVEVIAGPMFAGKTEELIRRVRRAAIAGRAVQVFTHDLDRRDRVGSISSHAGAAFPSASAGSVEELRALVRPETELLAVDEAQFFAADIVPLTNELALRGLDTIIAGLAVTFDGEPFEPVPSLMALAERVDKLTAVCTICGADAVYHQRIVAPDSQPTELVREHVGGLEKYEARCRLHFQTPGQLGG